MPHPPCAASPIHPTMPRLFIGIDVSKRSHIAGIVSATLLATRRFERCPTVLFEQARAGFATFLAHIRTYGVPPAQCAVLLENTGHYHRALVEWLLSEHFQIYMVAVRQKRVNGLSKTDRTDALRLANQLYVQVALGVQVADTTQEIRRFAPPSAAAMQLRGLVQRRSELQEEHTSLKNRLTAICDELFPEFARLFLDPNALIALDIRKRFPTPASIARATLEELSVVKRLRAPGAAKLEKLHAAAGHSIGVSDPARLSALVFEQEQLIESVLLLRSHLDALEAKITAIVAESREGSILLSLPAMGSIHAATFIACIGNIRNFPSVAKLRKFCGWSPQATQTGTSLDKASMTRTGSRLLRQSLFLLTMTAISHKDTLWSKLYYRLLPLKCAYDPRLKTYRGRMRVVGRIAGQMVSVIYCLLKQDADLLDRADPQHALPAPQLYDGEIHAGTVSRTAPAPTNTLDKDKVPTLA